MISWPNLLQRLKLFHMLKAYTKYFLGNITVMPTGCNTIFLFPFRDCKKTEV